MNTILIVDDEPIIVQGLCSMLSEMEHELVVWKAYSAKEALEIMEHSRIDILMTDIRMPGMTGLELAEIVRKQWRRCTIVFLSGYSDYEYLHFALRQGSYDYLLKPADIEVITVVVRRALNDMEQDIDNSEILEKAKLQYKEALPLLRKDFFVKLIEGGFDEAEAAHLQEQLDFLELPLRVDGDVLLMMGRIDRWPEHFSPNDRILLEYAVSNIAQEYLTPVCKLFSTKHERYIVWIIQASGSDGDGALYGSSKLHWYIGEMLEKVQQSVRHVLNLSISLILSQPVKAWSKLQQEYHLMYDVLQRGIGLEDEIVIDDRAEQAPSHPELLNENALVERSINQLKAQLEARDLDGFAKQLRALFSVVQKSVFVSFTQQMEVFCAMSAMFLTYLNKWKLIGALERQMDLTLLCNYQAHANWDDLLTYYSKLSQFIFEQMELERTDLKTKIIDKIDQHILTHLDGDLSLHQLAKQVHLSSYYLSRLYNKISGCSLAERIIQIKIAKAKEMLSSVNSGDIKIQDVAGVLGFDNMSYFSKYFKKHVGVTPVDFKEASRK
ncbi:response regulator transcription factor [Paenibacillus eucommiae]|uniref:Two-component system response regulator YesN n=1 Tax=Paenibacillus eucommiae TaxID=1355755 RepID=A0ABS4J382_9BACL|nr:response regulator [Paenibacillus eucommiae]MBP1993745.1 two-component system response regulator YesN [Paenibacillus eucommiae]